MINTLTLNPAVDKILYVDRFTPNITTRIKRVVDTVGGKGTHVSVNLSLLGVRTRAFGMVHGDTGRRVLSMLSQYDVELLFNEGGRGETRTNYLLNESNGDSTLITEKGVPLTAKDIDAICDTMSAHMSRGDYLVLSGDASNCADPYVYNYMLERLKELELVIFLDTSGESLKKCLATRPFLIKPNLDELETLCGHAVSCDDESVLAAIRELEGSGISVIAVSLGGDGSIVNYFGDIYRVRPPKIDISNTVGCGDSYLSGLLYGFAKGLSPADMLRRATGISAAAAQS